MLNNTTFLSIAEIYPYVRNKEISPVDLVTEIFHNIENKNEKINAFSYLFYESAKKDAKKAEKEILRGEYKGILHGIPLSVKDLIDVRGVPTTAGSKIYSDQIPNHDANVIVKLKNAGAILIGKENMHSLAYGSTGDVSYFGPVKNPLNTRKISGGSSSGSAASVASNMSFGSIGSDTGGSIRIPSALCGVVGMKPTFGLVNKHGTFSLSPTLDTLGPITRTVKDNAILLEAVANYKTGGTQYSKFEDQNITRKIGIPKNFYFDLIDNRIKESFEKIIKQLESKGYEIVQVELPSHKEFNAAHSIIFATEVYESMKQEMKYRAEKIETEIRTRILEGSFVKGHEYITMNRVRKLATKILFQLLEEVDVIITPTVGSYPCTIGTRTIKINNENIHIRGIYSRLVKLSNLTGFPSIALPTDKNTEGLANSIQLIGRPFQEKKLYKYASEIKNKSFK